MKLKKIISEWDDQSFKGLSKRWSKPYNQKGTDLENISLSEAPMDKVFQKDWGKSAKAFITHVKHELKTAKGADKTILKKMLQNLETVSGYPALMGRVSGMQENKSSKLKDLIEEIKEQMMTLKLKTLLESTPGFKGRKFGDPLPTLSSVSAAHAAKQVNERPINRGRVDYSTMELKSNIATKWLTTDNMIDDLTQWVQSVTDASGTGLTREIGLALKEMGVNIIKGQDVDGEDRPAGAASKFD